MGFLTLIQIPCHRVLANEIALNLKYHIGLKQSFNINLGICIIKNNLFCSYFWHISLCFYSNFDQESSLDVELNSACIHSASFWRTPLPQTQEIPEKMWWWCHHQIISGISCFWGRGVCQKYAKWVLNGCRIKFHIQWALSIKVWVKTQRDMSKIQTKK